MKKRESALDPTPRPSFSLLPVEPSPEPPPPPPPPPPPQSRTPAALAASAAASWSRARARRCAGPALRAPAAVRPRAFTCVRARARKARREGAGHAAYVTRSPAGSAWRAPGLELRGKRNLRLPSFLSPRVLATESGRPYSNRRRRGSEGGIAFPGPGS
jgi:hypothetical protein